MERLAFVVRHRRLVVGALVLISGVFSLAIPSLEVQFAPEELVAPDDSSARDRAMLEAAFGADENAVVVLVEASDVFAANAFEWAHGLATTLQTLPSVERVESPGTSAFPHVVPDDELSLEDLAQEDPNAAVSDALSAIVSANPGRFPLGLSSLGERSRGRVRAAPFVRSGLPTELERAAIEEFLEGSDLMHRRMVSDDHTVLLIAAILEPNTSRMDQEQLVRAVSGTLAEMPPPQAVSAHIAGLPAMRLAMLESLREDQWLLIALATAGSLLVLIAGMRSFAGVVLPMGTVGITLAVTMGGMAIAGQPINLLTNIVPPLLVTIGLAESVHMVLRFREELVSVRNDRVRAASNVLRTMWLPCFVTTFTTAIGFGALLLQETAILRRFGVAAAVATMVSYGVTVLFVPASLPWFSREGRTPPHPAALALRGLDRWVGSVTVHVTRRAHATAFTAAMLLLLSLFVARDVTVDSTLLDQFDHDSEVARVARLLETKLDGVRSLTVGVEAEQRGEFETVRGLARLRELTSWLEAQPGVLRATSADDWLAEARTLVQGSDDTGSRFANDEEVRAYRRLLAATMHDDPLRAFLSSDGSHARLEVRLADRGASRILAMLEEFRAHSAARSYVVRFGGEAWDASRGLDRIVRSLGSLASAVVLIFGVMMLLFRSVRLGLISIPPNALPLAMTLAYMALRGIPLHAATVIVFTVTIGLAVDGATHVIARFREERVHGGGLALTVERTMETSGRGVVLSSATLLIGYGAMLFSAFEPVRVFGELSAVAIAASLVAQLWLLPALLMLFAKESSVRDEIAPPRSQADAAEQ